MKPVSLSVFLFLSAVSFMACVPIAVETPPATVTSFLTLKSPENMATVYGDKVTIEGTCAPEGSPITAMVQFDNMIWTPGRARCQNLVFSVSTDISALKEGAQFNVLVYRHDSDNQYNYTKQTLTLTKGNPDDLNKKNDDENKESSVRATLLGVPEEGKTTADNVTITVSGEDISEYKYHIAFAVDGELECPEDTTSDYSEWNSIESKIEVNEMAEHTSYLLCVVGRNTAGEEQEKATQASWKRIVAEATQDVYVNHDGLEGTHTYSEPLSLALWPSVEGADIMYQIIPDGSDVTPEELDCGNVKGESYDGPLTITATSSVRAVACKEGYTSIMQTFHFIVSAGGDGGGGGIGGDPFDPIFGP